MLDIDIYTSEDLEMLAELYGFDYYYGQNFQQFLHS